jgi:hypothetical protein
VLASRPVVLLCSGVGLRRPFGAIIIMVIWRYRQANRDRDRPLVSLCCACRARACRARA